MILRIKKMQLHLPPIQGKIEFDNVSFSYEKEGETILNEHQFHGGTRGNSCICRDEWRREVDDCQSDSTVL